MHLFAKIPTHPLTITEMKYSGTMYFLHPASVTIFLLTVEFLCNWSIPQEAIQCLLLKRTSDKKSRRKDFNFSYFLFIGHWASLFPSLGPRISIQ